jgi:hypothetical protein
MYLCVITYQYDDRIVEIPGPPTSKQLAIAALSRDIKLTFGSEHVLSGRVYSEADFRSHQQRRVAEAALVAL